MLHKWTSKCICLLTNVIILQELFHLALFQVASSHNFTVILNSNSILKPLAPGTVCESWSFLKETNNSRLNVKLYYCRVNFENASAKGSTRSKISFLLLVEKENRFAFTFGYASFILKDIMASVHMNVLNFYRKVDHCKYLFIC